MGTMIEPIIKARATKARTPISDEPSAAADQTAGKQSQGTADKQKKEREICFIH